MARESLNAQMSNKLYRDEVHDFREAMRLVMAGMEAERHEWETWNASLEPDERDHAVSTEHLIAYGAAARTALAVYHEEVDAAEKRAIERIRALGGMEHEQIADALESGDYSVLAW